jgi:hypothetical protein
MARLTIVTSAAWRAHATPQHHLRTQHRPEGASPDFRDADERAAEIASALIADVPGAGRLAVPATADVDREGVRVAAQLRAVREAEPRGRPAHVDAARRRAAFELLGVAKVDPLAGLKQGLLGQMAKLPGSRLSPGVSWACSNYRRP